MVLSHKRKTRLLSSIPHAYSGFFSITSGILLTTSILYIVFLPGIALGQEWIQYKNLEFMLNYPAFLSAYELPNGVTLIPESEIGSEYASFLFNAYVVPYYGPSRTSDELASEITSQIVQYYPNAQFTHVDTNMGGIAALVEYTYDDSRATATAIVLNGKLLIYGYDFVMGPNESQYIYIGNSITSSIVPIMPTSNDGGLAPTQPNDGNFFPETGRQLDSFKQWNIENGARTDQRIAEQNEDINEKRNKPGTIEYCKRYSYDDC